MQGEHEYKGVIIWLDKGTQSGYYGRWKSGRNGFATLEEAKEAIDKASQEGRIRNGRILPR
jgi:hypothetical protein